MIIGDESKSIASVVHIDQSTKLAEFGLKILNWKQLQIQTQYFQKPGYLHWRGKRPCNKRFKCYFFVFCQESILKKYFPVKDKQLAPFLIIFSHLVSPSSVQVSLNCSGRDQAPTVERLWIYVSQGKVTKMTGGILTTLYCQIQLVRRAQDYPGALSCFYQKCAQGSRPMPRCGRGGHLWCFTHSCN